MGTALLIPWRPGDPHREAAWQRLRARHLELGRTVIEGRHDDGPWCKATAIADALARTDADIIAVHDADVWTDGLDDAIDHVTAGAPWAIPHRKVFRLAEGQLEPSTKRSDLDQSPYTGYPGGGVVVLRRETYLDCPLDPHYVGWGQEDSSWAAALTTLHGYPWRGDAALWHWWHPPQPRDSRVIGSAASKALWRRYQRAKRKPDVMRALIEEAKRCRATPPSTASAPPAPPTATATPTPPL